VAASNRWELVTCGLRGHTLVGTGAAAVRPQDEGLVREDPAGVFRWHRCLRCDAWVPRPRPAEPTIDHPPDPSEIEVPLRGRPLRDRWVLRLIAFDRLIHVLVLTALAAAIFVVAGHEHALQRDFNRIVDALQAGGGGPVSNTGVLGKLRSVFRVTPTHLREAGLVVLAYGILEAVEMVGLWFGRRWAEYLTFVATTVLVPFEVYEIAGRASAWKIITLIINLAIVVYLLLAKRLFGARGGGRAEREEKERDMSWSTLQQSVAWMEAKG
jgi:uncharacterized membrane protein (DUF2068 family)